MTGRVQAAVGTTDWSTPWFHALKTAEKFDAFAARKGAGPIPTGQEARTFSDDFHVIRRSIATTPSMGERQMRAVTLMMSASIEGIVAGPQGRAGAVAEPDELRR